MALVKKVFCILILLFSTLVVAETIVPKNIKLGCNLIEECDLLKAEVEDYLENLKTTELLIGFLKRIPLDRRIKKFSFNIVKDKLFLNVIYKPKIS